MDVMDRIKADKVFQKLQSERQGPEQAKLDVKAREQYVERLEKELREVSQGRLFDG